MFRELLAVLRKRPPGAERFRFQVPQPLVMRRGLIHQAHHPDRDVAYVTGLVAGVTCGGRVAQSE
ncbi:hypothetical protein SSOG_07401 [Streptomyces himastatinicus ATCC 53653]|uniref:Uncharacterized protein n=1 Tax=Streptomyces himastatinicus ATCC 53653 TaxID=457427 RepID=D9WKJ7_9ACTN|nr:hypothetical protein SSOG_07401 [Streptomyces himastatinicus ATCC 53653]